MPTELPELSHMIFGVLAALSTTAITVITFFLKRLLAGVDGIGTKVEALTAEFQKSKLELAVMQSEQARAGADLAQLRAHVDQELAALRARIDLLDRRRGLK